MLAGMLQEYGIRDRKRGPARGSLFVQISRGGQTLRRSLCYGGRRTYEEALASALQWRDEQLRQVEPMKAAEVWDMVRVTNTSGVPGVTFYRPGKQPEGIWQARLHLVHERKLVKTFSVKRHGYEGAFAKAVEARRKMVERFGDEPYLHTEFARRAALAAGHVAQCVSAEKS